MVGDNRKVWPKVVETHGPASKSLGESISEFSHAEQVNRVLFSIADAVNATQDLAELYATIHRTLGNIIDVTNFFIAIVDNQKKTLFFPYHVDTITDDFSPINDFATSSSLSGLVVAGKSPVLLRTEALNKRAEVVGLIGPSPLVWIGSPLIIRDEVIGVVAAQSYTDADAYDETDLQLLRAISQQIAVAIDRKRFLDELKRSEERYRDLVQNANSSIIRMDSNGRISFFNEFAERFFGYEASEVVGENVIGTIVPEIDSTGTDMRAMIADIGIRPQLYATNENENMQRDGTRVWISWTNKLLYNAKGEVSEILCVGNDITDRKKALEAQRESEERYKQVMRLSLEPIYMFDPETNKILESNPAFEKILGYTADEIHQLTIYHVIAHEQTSVDYHTSKIMAVGATDIGDRLWRRKDGTVFPVHVTANKIKVKGIDIIFVTARDLSERKLAEEKKAELEAQNRQLQKAESLGRMAGAIAHHFNNKLQAVLGNLEMAMAEVPRGGNPTEMLGYAMQAAQQAAEVSVMMLTYLGQTTRLTESLDLSESCRRSLILLQAAAPKRMVIKADFPSYGPVILGNEGQIQQVLTNLLTNAWEAVSENHGTVGLVVKTVSWQEIDDSNRFPFDWKPQDTAYACLEVTDTGHGIAKKDIENIFDPFFTTKFTGRGLGLPVVLGIVGAHGGGITVQSETGRGSVFRVFVPVSNMAISTITKKMTETRGIEEGGTVLVVEDEEMVRDIATMMLSHLGYKVLEAKDGIEALEVFHRHGTEISCVLSDLTMPRMDGWETLAELRSLSPSIPVIMASGYNESEVFAGDRHELPQAFLHKPYQILALKEALVKAMSWSVEDGKR